MKAVSFLVLVVAYGLASSKCSTFNFRYQLCHENWIPEKDLGALIKILDDKPTRINLWQKSYMEKDTLYFVFETRNEQLIDELSTLPGEFKGEGVRDLLGYEFGPVLAYVYLSHIIKKASEAKIKLAVKGDTSKSANVLMTENMNGGKVGFRFNVLTKDGKLAKAYDISEDGRDAFVKIMEALGGGSGGSEEE